MEKPFQRFWLDKSDTGDDVVFYRDKCQFMCRFTEQGRMGRIIYQQHLKRILLHSWQDNPVEYQFWNTTDWQIKN